MPLFNTHELPVSVGCSYQTSTVLKKTVQILEISQHKFRTEPNTSAFFVEQSAMAAAAAISGARVAKSGGAKSEELLDRNPFSHKKIDLDLGTEARLENEEVILDQMMERRVDRHWQAR